MNVQNWSAPPSVQFAFDCEECGHMWTTYEFEWCDDQSEGWAGEAPCPECNRLTRSGLWEV